MPLPEPLDFLAAGEALVDLISNEVVESLDKATGFWPYPGGQPSNLALAVARLGRSAAIAACVGDDGFGRLYLEQMRHAGVHLDLVQFCTTAPTTTAVVGRSLGTPDFIIHRGADSQLEITAPLRAAVKKTRVFHTSAFALARLPARATILSLLGIARSAGALITFDPNFHPSVWPDKAGFKDIVQQILFRADVIKPSLDDAQRIFGRDQSPEDCALRMLDLGVQRVLLTMGKDGTLLAYDGKVQLKMPSRPPKVADVTGAGDSFWAGFVSAHLTGRTFEEAACYGQAVAEEKLGYTGPLKPLADPDALSRKAREIYSNLETYG